MKTNTAAFIAKLAHQGQKYGGRSYIYHVRRVVARVHEDPEATHGDVVLAYLHDVVEDTSATFTDLEELGYDTTDLRIITRQLGQTYEDYIDLVKTSPVATRVKLADLRENLLHNPKPSLVPRYRAALSTLTFGLHSK